jgi:hypothetical protein
MRIDVNLLALTLSRRSDPYANLVRIYSNSTSASTSVQSARMGIANQSRFLSMPENMVGVRVDG